MSISLRFRILVILAYPLFMLIVCIIYILITVPLCSTVISLIITFRFTAIII